MLRRNGLTFVEFVVVLATLVGFLRLTVPNVTEFRQRKADSLAASAYEEIRSALVSLTPTQVGLPNAFMVSIRGGRKLPKPFEKVALAHGVTLHYLISLHIPGSFDLTTFEVSNPSGGHYFRFVWLNERLIEQTIRRDR